MSAQPTGIEAQVCADIIERQRIGVAKYGTTVADNPLELREWLNHAYQESLDAAIYLRRAIAEIDAAENIRALREKVTAIQSRMNADEDPWGFPEAQELLKLERAASARKLAALHPGNRFRLMFGQPLLPPDP